MQTKSSFVLVSAHINSVTERIPALERRFLSQISGYICTWLAWSENLLYASPRVVRVLFCCRDFATVTAESNRREFHPKFRFVRVQLVESMAATDSAPVT